MGQQSQQHRGLKYSVRANKKERKRKKERKEGRKEDRKTTRKVLQIKLLRSEQEMNIYIFDVIKLVSQTNLDILN